MKDEYFGVLCFILSILLFSVYDYVYDRIDSFFFEKIDYNYYIRTVDSLLSIKTADDFMKKAFPKLVEFTKSSGGYLYVFSQDEETYRTLKFSGTKFKTEQESDLRSLTKLTEIMNCPDDIIVKHEMMRNLSFEKNVISEMDSLDIDLAAPIYYHDIYIGFIGLTGMIKSLSPDYLATVKIFAAKIGSIQAHGFLSKEMIKKREFEKEKSIAFRVRKSLFSKNTARNSHYEAAVFSVSKSLITDMFYDIYSENDYILMSFYSGGKDGYDSMVFMPSLKVLIQSFIRMGYPLSQSVSHAKEALIKKSFIDDDFTITSVLIKGRVIEYYHEKSGSPVKLTRKSISVLENGSFLEQSEVAVFSEKELFSEGRMKDFTDTAMFVSSRSAYSLAEMISEGLNASDSDGNKITAVIKCI